MLDARSPGATLCPSEVARAVAADSEWRDAMPAIHDAVDRLLADGDVRLSWKGRALAARSGPYRIGRVER